MIHENIRTALVMESDVDWDMRIKQSMIGVGQGTKAIADSSFDPNEDQGLLGHNRGHPSEAAKDDGSPHGNKWDVIWLGHCGSSAQSDGRVHAFNDSAAPRDDHVRVFGPQPDSGTRQTGTRLVYHLRESVCTTAYAISNQGPHKLERIFRKANGPIDFEMWNQCSTNPELACVGVFPQIISMTESRTNIRHLEEGLSFGHEIKEESVLAGRGIQISARVNADGWKWEWKGNERGHGGESKSQRDDEGEMK